MKPQFTIEEMEIIRGDRGPVEYIKLVMKVNSYSNRDLLAAFGTRARLSEVLNYKRKLTLRQIRCLVINFKMNANVLIEDYELKKIL